MNNIQTKILNATSKFQLVSAGAGSGKTTVMINKIANLLIKDNADVDNLLVVTFTVLAANEMKDRLIAKLQEQLSVAENKQQVLNTIDKVRTANIDTIDGFNSKTIKKYFYELNISPNIEIISDASKDYFISRAIKKTFDEFSKEQENANLMLDLFGGRQRNFDDLKTLICTSYNNVINLENCDEFLSKCLDEYKDGLISENIINQQICNIVENVATNIKHLFTDLDKATSEILHNFLSAIECINSNLSFKTNVRTLLALQKPNISKTSRSNSSIGEIKQNINKVFDLQEDIIKNGIDEDFEEKNSQILKYATIFVDILKNFIKNYNNLKEKNNLIDFNDLTRLMLKLLKNDQIKNELQQKFKYIFIDEYQDVNPLQDKLMNLLVGENTNIFMVGDVKQSIYGFRGSSPEWFLEKYNTLKQESNENVFDMNLNFRSSPVILEFINQVFSRLMTEQQSGINYKRDANIEPQRDDIKDGKVEIKLVKTSSSSEIASGVYSVKNHKQQETVTPKDIECEIVLEAITKLVGTPFYDANLRVTRPLSYKDIAILTRSDKDESSFALIKLLRAHAVPIKRSERISIQDSEGMKLILSILKCVLNSADDVDYFATFMALTDLDINDFTHIRDTSKNFYDDLKQNLDNEQIKKGFYRIELIREASYSLSNADLVRFILNEQKLRYFFLQKPNGKQELTLIETFLDRLSQYENSVNLAEFIELLSTSVSRGGDVEDFDSENSLTLQTIHKSKGLEYPVVILFNSGKLFSFVTGEETVNFNSKVGFGFDFYNVSTRTRAQSLAKYAIKIKNNAESYKEELRLLYVACTRAKNRLIITGKYSATALKNKEIKQTSFVNMLLKCFADNITQDINELKNCTIELFDSSDKLELSDSEPIDNVEWVDQGFVYGNKAKFNITLKNTVTGINSQISQEFGFDKKQVFTPAYQYTGEENLANIGTKYHKAFELLDFSKPFEKNTDIEGMDYVKIEKAHSVLSGLFKNAINTKKEAEFMLYIPYNEIFGGEIADKILIQGIVDLIIEYKNSITIVDYKFSSLPANVLKQKYAEQLSLYKLAVEKAFKKPVDRTLIYSINTGELV